MRGDYKFVMFDRKRMAEHRYVMEQYHGEKLTPDEDVHHTDYCKTNNIPNNLCVLNRHKHRMLSASLTRLLEPLLDAKHMIVKR